MRNTLITHGLAENTVFYFFDAVGQDTRELLPEPHEDTRTASDHRDHDGNAVTC
jgi:hypothetical protein